MNTSQSDYATKTAHLLGIIHTGFYSNKKTFFQLDYFPFFLLNDDSLHIFVSFISLYWIGKITAIFFLFFFSKTSVPWNTCRLESKAPNQSKGNWAGGQSWFGGRREELRKGWRREWGREVREMRVRGENFQTLGQTLNKQAQSGNKAADWKPYSI